MPKNGNAEEVGIKKDGKPQHPNDRYKPEYCKAIIDGANQGKTITDIAVDWGVAKSTVYLWRDKNADFSDAFTRARAIQESKWFQFVRKHLTYRTEHGERIESSLAIYCSKVLHPDSDPDYTFKREQADMAKERWKMEQRHAEEKHLLEMELLRKQLHEGAPPRDTIELQEGILEGVNKIADRLIAQEVNKP